MIRFDLDLNTALPTQDLTLKTKVIATEYRVKVPYKASPFTFYIDVCALDRNQSSRSGSPNKSLHESGVLKTMPNPFSDYLELHISGQESVEPHIQLFDMKGQMIDRLATWKYTGNEAWMGSVNTQSLSKGIYLYKVQIGNKLISGKVIKQ